jgi:hypothetical protein
MSFNSNGLLVSSPFGWWFGACFYVFHILGIIIPTGELGRSTTNQFNIPIVPFAVFPPCHFFGAAWDDSDETTYGIFKSSFRSEKTMEKTMFNA